MPQLKNPAHEKVAQARATGSSQVEAHKAGGFRGSQAAANHICNRPDILERVKEITTFRQEADLAREIESSEIAAKRLNISKYWVLERLKYNAERCLRGAPVLDENGHQIPGKFTGKPDSAGANRALHLIGLEMGMFIERHEVGEAGAFDHLSDTDLLRQISKHAQLLIEHQTDSQAEGDT